MGIRMPLFRKASPPPALVEEGDTAVVAPDSAVDRCVNERGINMVDLMAWLVIASLLLAAALQGIGYYQKTAWTYQAKSDLSGAHQWAAARTSLTSAVPTASDMQAALTNGDLKLTSNGGVYDIGYIATSGSKYCIGVNNPALGDKIFYSSSDSPNVIEQGSTSDSSPFTAAECGSGTWSGSYVVPPGGTAPAAASASPSPTATTTPTASSTASPSPSATNTASASPSPTTTSTSTPSPTTTTAAALATSGTLHWASASKPLASAYSASASDTGTTLAVAVAGTGTSAVAVSTDSGVTWPKSLADAKTYYTVAVSHNGQYMVAAGMYGNPFVSPDGGKTWNAITTLARSGSNSWRSLAISNDGLTIVAGGDGGGLYITKNGGVGANSWSTLNTGIGWSSVAYADGPGTVWALATKTDVYSYAAATGAQLTHSTLGTGSSYLGKVAVSQDGQHVLYGAPYNSNVWYSHNSGGSFTAIAPDGSTGTSVGGAGVAISADGSHMIVDINSKNASVSTNGGSSWAIQDVNGLPANSYVGFSASSDNGHFAAVDTSGNVYTAHF